MAQWIDAQSPLEQLYQKSLHILSSSPGLLFQLELQELRVHCLCLVLCQVCLQATTDGGRNVRARLHVWIDFCYLVQGSISLFLSQLEVRGPWQFCYDY